MNEFILNTILFVSGTVYGSFLGLCVYRIPRKLPVVFDFSYCDFCEQPLKWNHKLPLVSYLLLGRYSACCGNMLPIQYFLLELAGGFIFLLYFHLYGLTSFFALMVIFTGTLITGFLIDIKYWIIPDTVTFSGMLAALVTSFLISNHRFFDSIIGLVFCGGFLFAAGWFGTKMLGKSQSMGGGDIKFAAMIGAFLGWQLGGIAVFLAAMLGTTWGTGRLILKTNEGHEIQFGPFLAAGALLALIIGKNILHLILI